MKLSEAPALPIGSQIPIWEIFSGYSVDHVQSMLVNLDYLVLVNRSKITVEYHTDFGSFKVVEGDVIFSDDIMNTHKNNPDQIITVKSRSVVCLDHPFNFANMVNFS